MPGREINFALVPVGKRVPGGFAGHERDFADKGRVVADEPAELGQYPKDRLYENDAELNLLAVFLEHEQSGQGFLECPRRLDYKVMD